MPHPPQIPLTPQTDERNFPRWQKDAPAGKSGHAYPKMLTKICTSQDRDEQRKKTQRMDRHDGAYWDDPPLRVGTPIPMLTTQAMVDEGLAQVANEPIIVNDREHEIRVLTILGLGAPQAPIAKAVSIPIAAPAEEPREPVAPKRKPGRPRKAKPAVQSQPEIVADLD